MVCQNYYSVYTTTDRKTHLFCCPCQLHIHVRGGSFFISSIRAGSSYVEFPYTRTATQSLDPSIDKVVFRCSLITYTFGIDGRFVLALSICSCTVVDPVYYLGQIKKKRVQPLYISTMLYSPSSFKYTFTTSEWNLTLAN